MWPDAPIPEPRVCKPLEVRDPKRPGDFAVCALRPAQQESWRKMLGTEDRIYVCGLSVLVCDLLNKYGPDMFGMHTPIKADREQGLVIMFTDTRSPDMSTGAHEEHVAGLYAKPFDACLREWDRWTRENVRARPIDDDEGPGRSFHERIEADGKGRAFLVPLFYLPVCSRGQGIHLEPCKCALPLARNPVDGFSASLYTSGCTRKYNAGIGFPGSALGLCRTKPVCMVFSLPKPRPEED